MAGPTARWSGVGRPPAAPTCRGSAAACSPERMSLTSLAPPSRREPDVRDAAPLGEPDLLAELGRRRRHLGRRCPAGAAPPRSGRCGPLLLGRSRATSTQVGTEPRDRQRVRAEQDAEHPGDADRDAHAGEAVGARRWPGCRSGRRSRPSRTARTRAAGSRRRCRCSSRGPRAIFRSATSRPGWCSRAASTTADQLGQALVEQRVADARAPARRRRRTRPRPRSRPAPGTPWPGPALAPAVSAEQRRPPPAGPDLVELVDGPQGGRRVRPARGRGRSPRTACGC